MYDAVLQQWGGTSDLWIFGYASLIWRPEFEFAEQRPAHIHGYHRALKMWSRINRGSPDCPGLVFALLSGGSCKGVAFRLPRADVPRVLPALWAREMPNGVYDPKWLPCRTPAGLIRALAFTLSRRSPNYTGPLPDAVYAQIFAEAKGRYGYTRDYARLTHDTLVSMGMADASLARLMALIPS
jgi:cation transport protein ChaC